MPHFLTGDELGQIKSIHCPKGTESSAGWKLEEQFLFTPPTHVQIGSGELEPEKAKERRQDTGSDTEREERTYIIV